MTEGSIWHHFQAAVARGFLGLFENAQLACSKVEESTADGKMLEEGMEVSLC